ncbi:MAG TPA: hypothetical protein DDY22_14665 [Geobacter sp.]|nr:hypothetical protein [Geobacter sp.]
MTIDSLSCSSLLLFKNRIGPSPPLKASLSMLPFYQISISDGSFHSHPKSSPVNTMPCYERMNPAFTFIIILLAGYLLLLPYDPDHLTQNRVLVVVFNNSSKGDFMKRFTVQKAHLVFMLLMGVLISSSLASAGSYRGDGDNNPPAADPQAATTSGVLGAAASFGVFGGGAGMTNQGIYTVVNGDIGTTAASTLVTGFHDKGAVYTETTANIGTVNGTVHTATAPAGSVPNVIAAAVALDAQTAFDNLSPAALPGGIDVSSLGGGAGELGNRTLAPGVYRSAPGSFAIQGGDLVLDGGGDPNAVWVFQMATTLTVGGPGAAFPQSVILVNGAQAKNVFWQVGSAATINAAGGGTIAGTIIAASGASFSTAGNVELVTLNGRALALHASVTMVNTRINVPAP